MQKTQKIKLFVGILYVVLLFGFLYFLFSKFSLQEILSYEFIKNNREYFANLKQTNFFFLSFIFILFTIVWVLAAGFISPIGILAGFIFGKWYGLIYLIFGMSVGATGLYVFANYFLKDYIKEKFLNRFKKLDEKFKRSELLFLLIYRFVGGIPFAISNVLPCIFNVKTLNFFIATLIGIIPQIFLIVSIGSGLEKVIEKNLEPPSMIELVKSPDIFIPLLIFIFLILITIFLRKIFYRK